MVGSIFVLLFVQILLHRYSTLREFLLENYEDSINQLPTWIIISLVYIVTLSTLISQYIPVIPEPVASWSLLGFSLNKLGFTICSILLFYIIRAFFSLVFFASVGHLHAWSRFYFASSKFYFMMSILLIVMNFSHYYFVTDKVLALQFYIIFLTFVFIFKILFYIFNKTGILPNQWYYKFLYICTLQIAPLFALWRFLFI